MPSLFKATRHGEYTTPRTVLGFYAGVLVILEAGVAVGLSILATNDDLHYLIPWLLGFGAFTLISVIVVVVVINIVDPTKLQLGHVTGREFLDYQRVRGDSIAGEYLDPVPTGRSPEDKPLVERAPLPELVESDEAGRDESDEESD